MKSEDPAHERTYAESDGTWFNALVGAAVTFVFSFTGVSPLLGGGVAGYLQGEGGSAGLRVGALSGLIALVPGALLFVAVLGFGSLVLLGNVPRGMLGVPVLALGVGLVVSAFVVGASAVGGLLGGALADR